MASLSTQDQHLFKGFNFGDHRDRVPDGTLEHPGRVDDQVMIRGFRCEPDRVAAAVEARPEVKAAAARLIESELCGFVTPTSVNVANIIAATSKTQPYYAVPNQVSALSGFQISRSPSSNPFTSSSQVHSNHKTSKWALRQLALNERSTKVSTDEEGPLTNLSLIPKIKDDVRRKHFTSVSVKLEFPPATYNGVNPEKVPNEICGGMPVLQLPGDNNVSLSTFERAYPWGAYENDVLPPKRQGRYLRNLRHQIFSLYRRLFGIVFAVNMSIFIAILCQGGASAQRLGLIVIANLSSSIFMRQDYVINAFFTLFCAVPLSWPLSIRTICARVYHIGGLHSGFSISGIVWLGLFTGQATRELLNSGPTSHLTVVLTYCILVLLLGMVFNAIPVLRSKHHNRFEVTHRFLGWASTLLVWCQVISLTNDYKHQDRSLGYSLLHAVPLWLVLAMTTSIVLPWVRLRKVPVRAVVLSSHAVRLYFDYATPVAGSFVRISDSPLTEWHSFGTVAEPGKPGFSLVVSRAGDWTSKNILNPPREMWVRGIPTIGFIHVAPLFRRLVLVATGSGIGPCMQCILEQRVPIRLLWTSPNVRQTFGNELVDTILEKSPDAVIYDTGVRGRPDMIKLTHRLVQEFKAEAVCIVSNQKLTQKVVYGMKSRGIPAFGAIWDS